MSLPRLAIYSVVIATPPILLYRKVSYLNKTYPLVSPPPEYLLLPALVESLPAYHPRHEFALVSTVIPRSPTTTLPTDGLLALFLDSFWSSWTLRIEGLCASLTGYTPTPYASGLFKPIQRGPHSQIVGYTIPRPIHRFLRGLGMQMIKGGLQELGVKEVEGGLELTYLCTEYFERNGRLEDEREFGSFGRGLHRFYMRILLDKAKNKFEKLLS